MKGTSAHSRTISPFSTYHIRQASAGKEDLIGKTAEVKIALEPKGVVSIQGERWTAISETDWVKPEEEVIVTKVDRLKLYVNKKQ